LTAQRYMPSVLTAAAIALLVVAATVATSASSGKTSLQEVSEGLTCQCGCGLTVANCNHPQCEFSVPARLQIESMIAQGMGVEQITRAFRAKYGEKILSAPTREGFNLLAWIIPFAAVFAGCFIIVGAISHWRASPLAGEEASAAVSTAYDPELRHRLEQELREQR